MNATIFFHNGFYRSDVHESIPEGAVPVTQEEYDALLEGQSQGKRIVADENGHPMLADPVADPASLAASRRSDRNRLLAASDWTQLADAPLTEEERSSWKAYRQALRDLPLTEGFPAVDMPPAP